MAVSVALGSGGRWCDRSHDSGCVVQIERNSPRAGADQHVVRLPQSAIVPVRNNLWDQYTGRRLIVLAPNAGLVIANLTATGAARVVRLYVNMELAAAVSF